MMRTYKEELANGLTQKEAAKLAQKRTGLSMRTGLPIQGPKPQVEKGMNPFHEVSKKPKISFGMYG